jgi:hypothetical protein
VLWLAMIAAMAGDNVALVLVESEGFESDASSALLRELGEAISSVTGFVAVTDDPLWSACAEETSCVSDVGARAKANHVVLAKIYGARTKVLLIADLYRLGAEGIERGPSAQATLSVEQQAWRGELSSVARTLFPGTSTTSVSLPKQEPPLPEPEGPTIAPWILFGASAVALGAGIGFGVSSNSAGDALMVGAHFDDEIDRLTSRMKTHAIVANVMYGVAGASAIAGIVFLFVY